MIRNRPTETGSNARQGIDHLLSFALLLASDVVGASFGAALRSFVRTHRWLPHQSPNKEIEGLHLASIGICDSDVCSSGASTSEERTQQSKLRSPSDSIDTINISAQKPAILSIKGLKNKGQTCYANSIFQALASLQPFCTYLQQLHQNENTSLARELYQTLQHINGHEVGGRSSKRLHSLFGLSSISTPIRNSDPCKVLNTVAKHHSQFRSRNGRFAGTSEQQDAHEFFTALMDVLSTEEICDHFEDMSSVKADEEDVISLVGDRYYNNLEKQATKTINESTISDEFVDSDEEEKKHDNYDQYQTDDSDNTCNRTNYIVDSELKGKSSCPFDGWSGSTIKCNSCHHIRPIRTAPFVALTLPIVNGTSNAVENFLSLEYGGFKTAERVSDVLCLSCAIQKKLTALEEEELLLRGAISRIKRRKNVSKTKPLSSMKETDNDILGLVKESERLKVSAAQLRSLDPDADEDLSDSSPMDAIEPMGMIDKSSYKLRPIRGDAWKATLIMRPPKVLCIHLQRRHFDYRTGQMVKLQQGVDFSETIYLPDSYAMYKLMSVVEHQGGAFGGHYVTYRRSTWDKGKNDWVLVSDQNVSPRHWNDVKKCQAYLLFYEAF